MHFPWFSSPSSLEGSCERVTSVKARATVEHHRTILRTGGQNHSFLSLRIESGFEAILYFLSKLSQASCFGGGRVTPSARAYFFSKSLAQLAMCPRTSAALNGAGALAYRQEPTQTGYNWSKHATNWVVYAARDSPACQGWHSGPVISTTTLHTVPSRQKRE